MEPFVRLVRTLLWAVAATGYAGDPELRLQLHNQVLGHTVVPYSSGSRFDTAEALARLDAAPADTNRVTLIYGGVTAPVSGFGQSGGWNREHLWPNSYGLDDVEPAFSDLHNLRACDANVNSSRGNKWYDFSDAAEGGIRDPAHAEAPLCTADANSWQPPSEQRGDIARALFYMDVRYEGDMAGEPDLRLVEDVTRIASTATLMGRLSALLSWAELDPPDDAERARNAAVAVLQGNRNPFVDDPSLAARVFMPRLRVRLDGVQQIIEWEATDLPLVLEFAPTPDGPWAERLTAPDYQPAWFARLRLVTP